MPQPLGTVASVSLTFIVTLILNATLNYYSSDKGTIGISKSIPLDSKAVSVLSIENYSREFLEGVAIELPTAIPVASLVSDFPVTLTDSPEPHRGASRIVKIGQISPGLVTRIIIPTTNSGMFLPIRVVNLDATGLTLRRDDELESPLRKAILTALVVASMYAVFAFGTTYYMRKQIKPLRDEIDTVKKQSQEMRPKFQALEARVVKQRLLLQARLFDYSKELSFWRNAFRTLALNAHGDKASADEAILTVTSALKTYGTVAESNHFEEIKIASAWLAHAEQDSGKAMLSTAEDGPAKQ